MPLDENDTRTPTTEQGGMHMGMPGPFAGSRGRYDSCGDCEPPRRSPNPDPAHFVVEKTKAVGPFLIVQVRYPDCTNYEGRKLLVYEDIDAAHVATMKRMDPHFDAGPVLSPTARFHPTERGWRDAEIFCHAAALTPRPPWRKS